MNISHWQKRSWLHFAWQVFIHVVVLAGAFVLLVPFFWTVSTSLKDESQVFVYPPVWIPNPFRLSNYAKVMTTAFPFATFVLNSLIITASSIVGYLFCCPLAAFGFSRLRFPGRDLLFIMVLSTMMLPYSVVMIPQYILFTRYHWVDTLYPLIVPSFVGGAMAPFFIFLLRQFLLTIPFELEDAARIDGCGTFGRYWRIILPLAMPALGVVIILGFMGHWNDFLGPLIYLKQVRHYTLALGLSMFSGAYQTYWTLLMSATVIAMIPCLILFFSAQKYFIQGIVITGIKG